MTPWEIIAEIENDNGRLYKLGVIEREARANNTELFEGFAIVYDPLDTFGVKKVPFSTVDPESKQLYPFEDFKTLCKELTSRELTGNAARDAINEAMLASGRAQWDGWYRRILIQDMRAGFTKATINKAVKKIAPHFTIPVFECMLAHDSKNHEKKLVGKKQIEVKLDGVRVITVLRKNGEVKQTSRNGKELVNFGHVKDQIAQLADCDLITEDMVIDGEIMSSNFQDLMTQVNRKSNVNAADAVLNVFDILPLREFLAGKSSKTQAERSAFLIRLVDEVYGSERFETLFPNVNILRSEVVDLSTDEGRVRYKEINKKAIDGGYEGIMLKDVDAVYECKRSTAWLKLKPFIEVSLKVIKVEEGTGKHEGRLGALVCEGIDDGKKINVNVGSGFSDAQREEYWADRDKMIGQIVEIRADAVTQNRDGTYSLRFPRFLHFRGFAKGEKI